MPESPDWIAVDWGTSNLRIWAIGRNGQILATATSDKGMARLESGAFAGVLTDLIARNIADPGVPCPVVICGMAGARQGWLEAAYLDVPADLGKLGTMAVRPAMPGTALSPSILPGLCQRETGSEDVMRGEETQLLGLAALTPGFSGLVCMPGTHAKWAMLEGTRVTHFTTVMTGEVFEALSTHTVLRHSLAGAEAGAEWDAGYAAGIDQVLTAPERLPALLFKVRATALLSGRQPDWCAGYLSGLLIGADIGGQRQRIEKSAVPLVGSDKLCALYAKGFGALGIETQRIDVTEATLAGLGAARRQMEET